MKSHTQIINSVKYNEVIAFMLSSCSIELHIFLFVVVGGGIIAPYSTYSILGVGQSDHELGPVRSGPRKSSVRSGIFGSVRFV